MRILTQTLGLYVEPKRVTRKKRSVIMAEGFDALIKMSYFSCLQ